MSDFTKIHKIFKKKKIDFFCGVPDSVLKNFTKNLKRNVITANEGSAIGMAIGYYLSKKKPAVVYLQNSGLSNAINPLSSIAHEDVYSIPIILIIGWRGSPNSKDEVQHKVKGSITLKLLSLLKIEYSILNQNSDLKDFESLIQKSIRKKKIVACIVPFDQNDKNKLKVVRKSTKKFLRKDVLIELLRKINNHDKLITSTGFTSREMFCLRKHYNLKKGSDFYMVGGMGHTSMVGYGASIGFKSKIICIDGDGSAIMHLGSLSNFGFSKYSNLKYILLNNAAHESVGNQPTLANKINFKLLSKAFGFKDYFFCKNIFQLKKNLKIFLKSRGPSFLECKISSGSIENLSRPKLLNDLKMKFMKYDKN